MTAGYSEQQYWLDKLFEHLPKVEGSQYGVLGNGGKQQRLDLSDPICREVVAESRKRIERYRNLSWSDEKALEVIKGYESENDPG